MRRFVTTAVLLVGACVPAQLDVTYLANEGFVVEGGGKKVLVDALFGRGVRGYATLPAATRKKLEKAHAPFDDVDLVLTTHSHPDHFDADVVARHLRANPKVQMVTTPQALAKLKRTLAREPKVLSRIHAALPEEGKRKKLTLAGVPIQLVNLHHGRNRQPPIDNLGFLVTLGDSTFLHVGDSVAAGKDLAAAGLSKDAIDVAFLPTWYLAFRPWKPLVTKEIAPKAIIAMHLPKRDAGEAFFGAHKTYERYLEVIRKGFPKVHIFEDSGDKKRIKTR